MKPGCAWEVTTNPSGRTAAISFPPPPKPCPDPQKAELVKLRYFMGMNYKEAATALGIAIPTAKQWWTYTRAWLSVELNHRR